MGDLLHELWSAPRNHHPTMLDTCVRHGRGGSKVFKEPLGAATAGAVARDFFSMHTHFDLFDDPIPEGWGRKGDPSTIPS